jgi:hypothetical protein
MDLGSLQSDVRVPCGTGVGIAVCVPLRRLVTSNCMDETSAMNTISVFAMEEDGTFPLLGKLGTKPDGPTVRGCRPKSHWLAGGSSSGCQREA